MAFFTFLIFHPVLTCPPACVRSVGWLCCVCCSRAALQLPTARHVYILLPSLTCSNFTTAWICFLIFAASSACLPSLWSIPSWFFKVWPIWTILASVVWEMYFRESLNCRTPNMSTLASSCGAALFFLLVFLTGRAQAALNPPVKQIRHRLQIRFMLSFTFLAFLLQNVVTKVGFVVWWKSSGSLFQASGSSLWWVWRVVSRLISDV